MSKQFISYSNRDGAELAFNLADELLIGVPPIETWVDKTNIRVGARWTTEIDEAIDACETLLFLMTKDSVQPDSVCEDECTRALRFKKPIMPLLFMRGLVPPLLLGTRQYIDFTGSRQVAMAKLRIHLRWLQTPEGLLAQLRDRLKDAERDLGSASDQDRLRIQAELDELRKDIQRQQEILADPEKATQTTQRNIAQAYEREREPAEAPKGPGPKFINPAPMAPPSHFQDRHIETKLLGDFLASQDRRIATVVGRGGTGKTAMVCRLLKGLERGELPDGLGALSVDGIVYLSGTRIGATRIFSDLTKLLPEADVARLQRQAQDPQIPIGEFYGSLLAAFPEGRTVLLLDNFETVVDRDQLVVRDASLTAAMQSLLDAPDHAVKTIITTQIQAKDLAVRQPGRQSTIFLDKGLDSPHAENVLRALDQDGTVGLKTAPQELLSKARERTRGFPRALEALYAILIADRSTTLEEILNQVLPESVVDALVGEAFRRLDQPSQEILQALAVLGHPVPAEAVDYLLQPFHPAANSAPVLNRLVNMQFARKDSGRYFLHPADREYALARVPDRAAPEGSQSTQWTRRALMERAANYFTEVRVPREKCRSLADLAAQQAEFDLRLAIGHYDTALAIVGDVYQWLERWGHYRLMDALLERLEGKVGDPVFRVWFGLMWAGARMRLGDIDKAISLTGEAQLLLRDHPNPELEAAVKCTYGSCMAEKGQTEAAIANLQDALEMARSQNNKRLAADCLSNRARCYVHLGRTDLSLQDLTEALQIGRDVNDLDTEPLLLNNIANCQGRLGQFQSALETAQEGLEKAQKIDSALNVCCNRTNIGMLLIDSDRVPEAVDSLTKAVEIADNVSNRQFQDEARQPLALAYFCLGDYPKARAIALEALSYSGPQQNQPRSGLVAFLGILALRLGDREEARTRFSAALEQANEMLEWNAKHFAVLEIKGLALCGLLVCDGVPDLLSQATAAYNEARALTKDAGVVKRALRLFDGIGAAAPGGLLHVVRPAVEGCSVSICGST
jgi:tetratricopeptide (TPR) repeat protein